MKLVLTTVASTAVMGLATLLSPMAAFACKPPSSEHCYGEASWDVEGQSGSGFKGLYALLGINSEALHAWNQEGSKNFITNEEWVEWSAGLYWNESGEILGCIISGCTPEHEDRWFWFFNSEGDGETGALSSEGGGAEEWEVDDYYNPSNKGWYINSKNWATYAYGQPSSAPILKAGVEVTTTEAINSAGARDLDWEDLQGKWHYSDWASGSSHALLNCDYPARTAWISAYTTFGYGVNIEWPCDSEDAMVSPPTSAEESSSSGHSPGLKPMPALSPLATLPNSSATGTVSVSELKTRATALAANLGEPDPSSIEVAKAPRAQAIAAVTPGMSFDETGKQKEWLGGSTYAVVLHGHFESAEAPSGKRQEGEVPSRPYTTLSVVIDAKTGEVNTFNLTEANQQQPAISQLGDVSTL
jgi:hypothetical protein